MKFELSNHVALQHPDWRNSDQYYIPEHLSAKERSILKRSAAHCPVGNSLSADLIEAVNFL